MKVLHICWTDEKIREKWDFVGAEVMFYRENLRLQNCPHGNRFSDNCQQCGCFPEVSRNTNFPSRNFAYPLFSEPSEDKIYRVCRETNCTVARRLSNGNYYLALTGDIMNLSQDIALAYIIVDDCIEWDMLEDIYISRAFSVTDANYQIILKHLKRQLYSSIETRIEKFFQVMEQLKE